MNQDQLRAAIASMDALARLLFEQQFIRHGGRKPADPEWDDDSVDRDDWRDRALDVAPLLADRDAKHEELMANRIAVLDECVAELARTRGKLGEAQGNHWAAREALERAEASRRDWAAEALRMELADEAQHCTGAHDCTANVHVEGCFYSDEEDPRHPRFMLPCGHTNTEAQRSVRHEVCSVHPESDAAVNGGAGGSSSRRTGRHLGR